LLALAHHFSLRRPSLPCATVRHCAPVFFFFFLVFAGPLLSCTYQLLIPASLCACCGCRRGQERPSLVPTVISGKLEKEFVGQAACGWKHSAAVAGRRTPWLPLAHILGSAGACCTVESVAPHRSTLQLRAWPPVPSSHAHVSRLGRALGLSQPCMKGLGGDLFYLFFFFWCCCREQALHLGLGGLHGVPCH